MPVAPTIRHCNPPESPAAPRHAGLAALTFLALLVHGYHPLAEDGGLYAAGVEYTLDPTLFPHNTAFVTAHLAYSIFSPLLAALVRLTHLPLAWMLFLVYVAAIWLTLYAAQRIAHQCFQSQAASFAATALFTACFTVPVAGTSLLLMDPCVTARTLSLPFSLLAISFMLPPRAKAKSNCAAAACLLISAAFHPLMAAYAASFIATLLVAKLPSSRTRLIAWSSLALAAIAAALAVQSLSPPESTASIAADISRYYWFLSQWQWFELFGLIGPLLVLALLHRLAATRAVTALSRAAIAPGIIATFVSILFAREHYTVHAVARLQPLRAFLIIYAVMFLMLGGSAAEAFTSWPQRRSMPLLRVIPPLVLTTIAAGLFAAQRATFPASRHLELPWRAPANPWSQAFLWARDHTPSTVLFALDADYITRPGEDAHTFRATAQRSALADFSKDGGEAAITPSLAQTWLAQSAAQQDLSDLDDAQRDARLKPLAVDYLILLSSARTAHPCPYDNATVKVCLNSPPPQSSPRRP